MDTNTPWERMILATKYIFADQYSVWSCLRDGKHIFRVERTGVTPSDGDGGYFSIDSALKVKGLKP